MYLLRRLTAANAARVQKVGVSRVAAQELLNTLPKSIALQKPPTKRRSPVLLLVLSALVLFGSLGNAEAQTIVQCPGTDSGSLCNDGDSCPVQDPNRQFNLSNLKEGDTVVWTLTSDPTVLPGGTQTPAFVSFNPNVVSFTNISNSGSSAPPPGEWRIGSVNGSFSAGEAEATYVAGTTNQTTLQLIPGQGQDNYAVLNWSYTCTRPTRTIEFKKKSEGSTGVFGFEITPPVTDPPTPAVTPSSFDITTTNETDFFPAGSGVDVSGFESGTYTVQETFPTDSGWKLVSVDCGEGVNASIDGDGTSGIAFLEVDNSENADEVTCEFTNEFTSTGTQSMTLEKQALQDTFSSPGQVIQYEYTVTNTGNEEITNLVINDDKVSNITCVPTDILPGNQATCTGSYIVQDSDLTACRITNVATAQGETQTTNPLTSNADEATITCTGDQTEIIIRGYLKRRVDLLASNEPDRARMLRRFDRRPAPVGSLKDGPMKLMGSSDANSTQVSFATSLSQIAQANMAASHKKANSVAPMGLGATATAPTYYPTSPGFDVWVEGHFQRYDDELGGHDQDGKFGILYVGADYLVSPTILIGMLAQFDWMNEETTSLSNAEVDGRGWMVGPYATVKITENLFFDTRGAWGKSDNDITPFGTYTDSFDTDRWLAKANLTGNWSFGQLAVTPSVGVIYVEESSDAYVDSVGNLIRGQSVRLGRLTFGPEFRYTERTEDGAILQPHVSFTGMWDFDQEDDADLADVGGLLVSDDDFRVKIEGGVLAHNPNFSAASFRATLSYDGVGADDFSAWGGQLWVNWPLN